MSTDDLEQERDAWHALANFRTVQRDREKAKKERLWNEVMRLREALTQIMAVLDTTAAFPEVEAIAVAVLAVA